MVLVTLMYVGASTGRDGIHGATFASEELSESSKSSRGIHLWKNFLLKRV